MNKILLISFLSIFTFFPKITTVKYGIVEYARCTGSSNCKACKNCSACAHCNNGGSCGVCSIYSNKIRKTPTAKPIRRNNPNINKKQIKKRTHISNSGNSRIIHIGPRGGKYYINGNGNKTYVK